MSCASFYNSTFEGEINLSLKIAVLSGKGGTGKTTISTNLAKVLSKNRKVLLLDADVEEPNFSVLAILGPSGSGKQFF